MGDTEQQSSSKGSSTNCTKIKDGTFKSVNNLTCFYTNADNLLNKKNELASVIALYSPQLVFITEFAPKSTSVSVEEAELHIDGYNLWTNAKKYKRGVLIYTAIELHASLLEWPLNYNFDECIWVQIELKDKDKLLLGCVYRSPNSDATNNAQMCFGLKNICNQQNFSHILLCGDFNFPQIDWENSSCGASTNHCASNFLECVNDCYLYQHVKDATHHRLGQNANVLDLVLTNEEGTYAK